MKIEIWSKDLCPYCENAKRWFKSKNLEYTEYKIGSEGVTRETLLERVPHARTVPQIFINDELVGGWDDLRKTEFYLNYNR